MALRVTNLYHRPVYVAVLYPNYSCSGYYAKKGWWYLYSGQQSVVLSGTLSNQFFYYIHADCWDGAFWGDETWAWCPYSVFNLCANTKPYGSVLYGFDGVYTQKGDLNVNLVPMD